MSRDNATTLPDDHTVCVSVIILTYNHKNFIAQAIEGALQQQTTFPYEIIIGEDESQDGTREICIEYAEKYPNLIRLFLRSRKDVIHVDNRPTGRFNLIQSLKAARGKYIAMCEGDDYWTDPCKLQKQVNFLEANPDYVLCHHDAVMIDSDDQVIQESMVLNKQKRDLSPIGVVKNPEFVTATVCYRNVLSKMPPEFMKVRGGDTFLFSILGLYGKARYVDNVKVSCYRRHSTGVWSSLSKLESLKHMANIRYWLGKYYARIGKKRYAYYYLGQYHMRTGMINYHTGYKKNARKHMVRSLRLSPWCWTTWHVFLSSELFGFRSRSA